MSNIKNNNIKNFLTTAVYFQLWSQKGCQEMTQAS